MTMANRPTTFGEFIIRKRAEKDMTARQLAGFLKISPVYLCDIEKDRKAALSNEMLETIKNTFDLSESETDLMYDLAAKARNTVSADLPQYIMDNELVRTALRTAKKNKYP